MRSCGNKDVLSKKLLVIEVKKVGFCSKILRGSVSNLKQLIHHNIGNSYLILVIKLL